MIIAPRLTPEVLIETPRRGEAIPSPDGTKALYTCSTHTIGGDTVKEIRVLVLATGTSHRLTDNSKVHDAIWLDDDEIVHLVSGENGFTQLKVFSLQWSDQVTLHRVDSFVVADFHAPVRNLKVLSLNGESVALAVIGRVDSNGNLFNEKTAEKKSSIRTYDTFRFRSVSLFSVLCCGSNS